MQRKISVLLVFLVTLACNALVKDSAPPTPAPTAVTSVVIPDATVLYYDIQGMTEDELREQLDLYGLIGPDGYRGDAVTEWRIEWTWEGYGMENCDLQTVSVTHEIKVTMPRWVPKEDASPELVARWGEYILALANHEQGHVVNATSYIPALTDSIRRATCLTPETSAQAVLDKVRQYDREYDARTLHGETQGAVFP